VRDGDLETAIALMQETDALADTVQRARAFGAEALAALDDLPAGPLRDALAEAVEFCIARVS
jgi:octaprenyl-diphosphate synthase